MGDLFADPNNARKDCFEHVCFCFAPFCMGSHFSLLLPIWFLQYLKHCESLVIRGLLKQPSQGVGDNLTGNIGNFTGSAQEVLGLDRKVSRFACQVETRPKLCPKLCPKVCP